MNRDLRQSSARSKSVRRPTLLFAIVATGLSLAACGSTNTPNVAGVATTTLAPSTGGTGATGSAVAFAFTQCMQTRGVPNFPEPNSSGAFPKETPGQLGVTVSKYRSTLSGCSHLLPNGGSGPSGAEIQYVKHLGLQFAQCMRGHGISLPDPGSNARIPDPATVGINQGSPQFEAANQACGKYRPPYMPSNAEYNAYASSQG
jgi:hypothetical protein